MNQWILLAETIFLAVSPMIAGCLFGVLLFALGSHPAVYWVGGAFVALSGYGWTLYRLDEYSESDSGD